MTLWAVKDSNLRSLLTTDLQSVPFGHLGNCPYCICFLIAEISLNRRFRADDENRTRNRPLTRRVLCRLSYVGKSISGQIIPKQPRASSVFEKWKTGNSIYGREKRLEPVMRFIRHKQPKPFNVNSANMAKFTKFFFASFARFV